VCPWHSGWLPALPVVGPRPGCRVSRWGREERACPPKSRMS
jgi:hypothetical protein